MLAVLLRGHVDVNGDDEHQAADDELPEGGAEIAQLCDQYVVLDPASQTEPQADNRDAYEVLYQRYRALDQGFRPLHKELTPP